MTNYNNILKVYLEIIPAHINLFDKQKKEVVWYRSLFYKILTEKYGFSIYKVAEYSNKNHASIINSLRKYEDYFQEANDTFKDVCNLYFKAVPTIIKKVKTLEDLISTIPIDKRDEIFELVNLRIKSWSWKSKDHCTIIEGYSPMTHTF